MRNIIWDDKEWNMCAELQAALHAELILEKEEFQSSTWTSRTTAGCKCAAAILLH